MSLLHATTLLIIIRADYVTRQVSIPNFQGIVVIVLVLLSKMRCSEISPVSVTECPYLQPMTAVENRVRHT